MLKLSRLATPFLRISENIQFVLEMQSLWRKHTGLRRLLRRLRLTRSAGYVTLADIGVPDLGCAHPPLTVQLGDYCTLRFHIRSAEVVYYVCEIRNSTLVMIDRFKFCLP